MAAHQTLNNGRTLPLPYWVYLLLGRVIFSTMKTKRCDNCGKLHTKTHPNSRLTLCCSTYDKDHKNAFYNTVDKYGNKVYSIGKAYTVKLRFPIRLRWVGLWGRP